MKRLITANIGLTRRNWLVVAGAAVTGCGGGGGAGGLVANLPGTGGTGSPVFSQGTISGFGSVIVNGIKFDDAQASVKVDGVAANSADLRLGMVASVLGARGTDLALGTASSVEVWSIAQGAVKEISTNANEFSVAGVSVQTDDNTTFEGVAGSSALTDGVLITVWGMQAGADSDHWLATRVAVLAATSTTAIVSSGVVKVSHSLATLNGLTLTGSLAAALTDGQLLRVQGSLSAENLLTVAGVQPIGTGSLVQSHGAVEVEGFVTSVASSTRFKMGAIEVDAGAAIYSPAGTVPALNSRLEVYGDWSGTVLKATQVLMQDQQTLKTVEITANIDQFTSSANFLMRGQRCDASNATFSQGASSNLRQGIKVKVSGLKAGDILKVGKLNFSV